MSEALKSAFCSIATDGTSRGNSVEGFANSRYFARDDVFGSDPCKQKSIPGRKRPHPEPQEAWLARIGYSTIFSEAAALASAVLCDGNTEGAAATDTGASSASAPAL